MLRFGWWGSAAVMLAVLKLTARIDWPWGWILSPVWIWGALVALTFVVAFGVTPWLRRKGD